MLASSTPEALWRAPSLRLLRPAALSCRDVRRRPLLDGCSLEVAAGSRVLLVSDPEESAPALVRVLAGMARPERGEIRIAGLADPSNAGWGRRVAYLGPEPGIHAWMTPREALELAGGLLGLSPSERARRSDRVLRWVGISEPEANRPLRREGPPLAQRAGLAAALLADPEVLLLAEPLRAIDADERRRILRVPGRRRTVILASRYPASEAGIATHVALLQRGRTTLEAPIEDLAAADLPLSLRGILTLAAERRRAGERTARGRAP